MEREASLLSDEEARAAEERWYAKAISVVLVGAVAASAAVAVTDARAADAASRAPAPEAIHASALPDQSQPLLSEGESATGLAVEAPEQPAWWARVYQDNGCDDGNTLRVNVTGEGGRTVGAQVSIDHVVNQVKVNTLGVPIPQDHYSDWVIINPDLPPEGAAEGGVRTVCFENIPEGAESFVEVYKKDGLAQGTLDSSEEWFGHGMAHGVTAGQAAEQRSTDVVLPAVCRAENGDLGDTGSIHFSATINGAQATTARVVAWSRTNDVPGFGAEDRSQNGTEAEPEIRALQPGEYLTQTHFVVGEEEVVVVDDSVPVGPCQRTEVRVEAGAGYCTMHRQLGAQVTRSACSTDRFIG